MCENTQYIEINVTQEGMVNTLSSSKTKHIHRLWLDTGYIFRGRMFYRFIFSLLQTVCIENIKINK